ncbi:MAG: hypothetical protein KAX38_01715, partial [Candidatus Krumholzibacteria bacterium]|nr:hypothetical protein [Candidatus Krumholzibacteria bacterium]
MKFLAALPALLPFKASVKLGWVLGIIAFDLVRIRRRVTLENLERALGHRLNNKERVKVGRRSYINFAKSMIEFASFGRLKREDYPGLVRMSGLENFDEVLSRGSGVIVVTG